jgi:hypothetical protein
MPSSNQATGRPYWNSGRAFASMDPERQGEVLGYVRNNAVQASPARQPVAKSEWLGWTRIQPDVESSGFEGSSSGRWR